MHLKHIRKTGRYLGCSLAAAFLAAACVAPGNAPGSLAGERGWSGAAIAACNVERLERQAALDLPGSVIVSLAFAPDRASLLIGDMGGRLASWEPGSGRYRELAAGLDGFGFDEDGKPTMFSSQSFTAGPDLIATADSGGWLRCLDRTAAERFSLSLGEPLHSLDLSLDGRWLAVGGEGTLLRVFETGGGTLVADLSGEAAFVTNLAFSPDGGSLLASYERPANVMKIWDTATWRPRAVIRHSEERYDYHDLAFAPDGRSFALASTRVVIELFDAASGSVGAALPGHQRAPYNLAFSPDGLLLASASDDGTVCLWDVTSGACLRRIPVSGEARAVVFSADGSQLAFGVQSEGPQVWALRP